MFINRIALSFVAACILLLSGNAFAQTAQSPLPKPTGYVNDFAGVIDSATKQRLETTLASLDRQQDIQIAVVTVDTTGGQDIFDYSLAVARGWGIGSKDARKPSLLLLVAIKDRQAFTQVSRHLEGDLPDGLVGQIERERIVPAFKAGQYGQGLSDTIDAYINIIAEKNGFTVNTNSNGTPRGRPADGTQSPWGPCGIAIFIGVIIVILIVRSRGRGGPWTGGGGGWVAPLIANVLLNSLASGGRRSSSSGWGGGGFGGSSGGGSSGGGGFGGFGGGGDFGGGGAGVSW